MKALTYNTNFLHQQHMAAMAAARRWKKIYALQHWCHLNGITFGIIHDSCYLDRNTVWCCLSGKLDSKLAEIFGGTDERLKEGN